MNHNIYWYDKRVNMGDLVGPWLAEKILGVEIFPKSNPRGTVCLCGSLIGIDKPIHWGTGLMFKGAVNRGKRIYAVRGPLTRQMAIRSGCKSPGIHVIGDPGLALSKFYFPQVPKKYKLGIIPHYVDKGALSRKLKSEDLADKAIKIIDIQQGVESFVNDLLECETTISSTLHGMIVSVSYGIPTRWIQLDKRIGGDDIKYYDFLFSLIADDDKRQQVVDDYVATPRKIPEEYLPVNYRKTPQLNIEELLKLPIKYEIPDGLVDKLLAAFPKEVIKISSPKNDDK